MKKSKKTKVAAPLLSEAQMEESLQTVRKQASNLQSLNSSDLFQTVSVENVERPSTKPSSVEGKKPPSKLNRKTVTWDRKKLFDDLDSPNVYPLHRIAQTLQPVHSTLSDNELNFTGIEQLTDVVFVKIQMSVSTKFTDQVTKVNLSGCSHVTDQGVDWMMSCFPNVTEVILDGCENVTNKSLKFLEQKKKTLRVVSAVATNISIIPPSMAPVTLTLTGCPLISPSSSDLDKWQQSKGTLKMKPLLTFRASICLMGKLSYWDLIGYLNNEESTVHSPLKYAAMKLKDGSVCNMIQASEGSFTEPWLLTERTVYVLTFNAAKEDTNSLISSLSQTIVHITAKVETPVFLLLGTSVNSVQLGILDYLLATISRLKKDIEVLKTDSKLENLTFQNHCELKRSKQLVDSLETTRNRMVTLEFNPSKTEDKEKIVNLLQELRDSQLKQLYPEYDELSSDLVAAIDNLPKLLPASLISMETAIKSIQSGNWPKSLSSKPQIKKALQLANIVGTMMTLTSVNTEGFVVKPDKIGVLSNEITSLIKLDKGGGSGPKGIAIVTMDQAKELMKKSSINLEDAATQGVLKEMGVAVVKDTNINILSSIPSEPVLPLKHFWDVSPPDNVLNVSYEYIFPHTLTESIIRQLLKDVLCLYPSAAQLVWKDGLFLQDSLVNIFIEVKLKSSGANSIILHGRIMKPPEIYATVTKSTKEILWNCVEQWKLILEGVISHLELSCNVKCSSDSRPDNIVNCVTRHKMEASSGKFRCDICYIPSQAAIFLSRTQQRLYPAFLDFKSLKQSNTPTFHIEGSLWRGNTTGSVSRLFYWSPYECNSFKITVLEGSKTDLSSLTFNFIDSKSSSTFPTLTIGNGKLSVEGEAVKPQKPPVLKPGDVLEIQTVELSPLGSDKNTARVSVWINEECVYSLDYLWSNNWQFSLERTKVNDGMLLKVELPISSSNNYNNDLVAGMRLEARDRQNPLICVATIEKIENDKVLIHFDGWTIKYDYWAELTSPDLHPLGYQKFIGHKHSQYRTNLQAPKGYGKAFDWGVYLKEVNSLPVPHSFFTQEQTEDTPPTEELRALETSGLSVDANGLLSSCQFQPNRSICIEKRVNCFLNDPESLKNMYSKAWSFNKFPCLLPAEFKLETLDFPARRLTDDFTKQNVHFLCSGLEMETLHFVNSPGFPAPYEVDHLLSLSVITRYIALVLLNQENFLPGDMERFCPEISSYSTEMAEKKLLRVFRQYLSLFELFFPWNKEYLTYLSSVDVEVMAENYFKKGINIPDNSFLQQFIGAAKAVNQPLICHAHKNAQGTNRSVTEINIDDFKGYTKLIHKLTFSGNNLTSVPENLDESFTFLAHLDLSHNALVSFPANLFTNLTGLESLNLSSNQITMMSPSLETLSHSLTNLNISNNPLGKLPQFVLQLSNLVQLHADNIGEITRLEGIEKLAKLRVLSLNFNLLTHQIPEGFGSLELTELCMAGLPWLTGYDSPKSTLSLQAFVDFMEKNTILNGVDKQKLFAEFDKEGKGHLTYTEVSELNNKLFAMFPRFGDTTQAPTKNMKCIQGGLPKVLLSLTKLRKLDLSFHRLTSIPPEFGTTFKNLSSLRLSNNPVLEALSPEVGGLPLKELHLKGCGQLKTPPKEIINRGFTAVFGYLKRLQMGSVSCRRTKLMVVGLGGAGKTSLIRALTRRCFIDQYDADDMYELMAENITDGIDITKWNVTVKNEKGDESLEYSVWDFAGQTVYYNTHQFFLSTRAVYLLLWNIRLGYEHAGLEFWLSSIACHAPGAPVFVVGTHCDKVEKTKMPTEELQQRFPQIKGFHSVSSFSLTGIPELQKNVIELTLKEKYMGEQIPEAWLTMEQKVKVKAEKKVELLPLQEVAKIAHECGIFDQQELIQAIEFLHDLGSVQFFNTELLRTYVVINPQWIVDVMTCVVSVHEGAIKDGRFAHKDMTTVWSAYPKEMHTWLLRLTETFDLTFPINKEAVNLVPCLLPDKEPQYDWPAVDDNKGYTETKMIYQFRYLPAGLFNRVQVRLNQFSDDSVIWKKGSLLKKNSHIAIIRQVGVDQLLIKVQGPRPQNIIYLFHEVLECLITESFYGVQYDFSVPCNDCLGMMSLDPCMINSSKIQRAVELTVPFLQCDKYFHTQSVKELQAAIPSSGAADLDLHLGKSIHELQELHDELVLKVFFSYCQSNVPTVIGDDKSIHPDTIMADLRKAGMKVTCTEPGDDNDFSKLTMDIKESDIVLIGMSDEYVNDKACAELLVFARDTLRKTAVLVILGKGFNWRKSPVGIICANDVYVDMQNVTQYPSKIQELIAALRQRTEKSKVKDYPSCFISYCWSNSKQVIDKGGKVKDGAIGAGDPREVKEFLHKNGISCWLDVEQVGKAGLYEDIAAGLRRAKVIVAFVSNEYAESKNCQMEFRYAVTTLKIPTIVVIVGTGYNWERSEVGMLSIGYQCPKVNFQYDNPSAMEEILAEVKKLLPEQKTDQQGAQPMKNEQQIAFQEELELAQRKFFRYICSFAESMDCEPYPRLIVLDLAPVDNDSNEVIKEKITPDIGPDLEQLEKSGKIPEGENNRQDIVDKGGEKSKYCFTLLCEWEEGWHDVSPSIAIPAMGSHGERVFLDSAAGYMARQMAILKNTSLTLNCMTSTEGQRLYEEFSDTCTKNSSGSDLQDNYIEVRKLVMELDEEGIMGNLKKCHLTNGKTAWLCPRHQNQVGIVSTEDTDKPIQPTDEDTSERAILHKEDEVVDDQSKEQPQQLRALQRQKNRAAGGTTKPPTLQRTTSRACNVM